MMNADLLSPRSKREHELRRQDSLKRELEVTLRRADSEPWLAPSRPEVMPCLFDLF